MSSESNHPYHMVEPSPWPLVGAVAALLMAPGAVVFMHGGTPLVLIAGFAVLIVTFFGWWRDVVAESLSGQFHNAVVSHGLRFGMVLFIASEVMFFFAFFWAFFHASVPALSFVAVQPWPPEGVAPFNPWDLPFLNTLILLTSGVTVTYAHHAIRLGDSKRCANGILLTVILGAIFTAVQAYEYGHAAFGFTEGIYSSTFYLATGFHGFHVIVGTTFLFVCWLRAVKGQFSADKHIGFESAAWYWHFVDVVWLFLFICVYWWGGAGAY
ncbi:MAG: cytochrome c oxidase subunit 3 [Rhodospirillales bacterium]